MSRMTIHKAVIPVAGLGTRLRPLSAVVPKAMMPVPDSRGRVLPVLHHVLAEVAAAGVSEAAVVASPSHVDMLRTYLRAAAGARGTGAGERLPGRIEVLTQREPLGFGHAVWLGKRFVGREPFLVMLGDHIQVARAGQPACAAQVTRAFALHGVAAMIGVQPVGPEELPRVGVAGGEPLRAEGPAGRGAARGGPRGAAAEVARRPVVFRCTGFVEKPTLAVARERLRTPGLPRDRFLAHCGIYAFTPEIFDCLEESMAGGEGAGRVAGILPASGEPILGSSRATSRPGRPRHEVQLAGAQSILLARHPKDYHLVQIDGRAYDTGTPAGYVATWMALLGATRAR